MVPKLYIPFPAFDSVLVKNILELEKLKVRRLGGTTPPGLFFQIKSVYHFLESLNSARIEGNRTTVEELVEARIHGEEDSTEKLREIANIEDGMKWIESEFLKSPSREIDAAFLKELHRLTVKNLRRPDEGGEGDKKPGYFRSSDVVITGTHFKPPSAFELGGFIDELVAFTNQTPDSRFDLLRIAICHHRFELIHPFTNGNGRVGRLLTYAMLIKAGFRVEDGRILNPSAVFCLNRDAYMLGLSMADSGSQDGLLQWCDFVISGLRREIEKIDLLLDVEFLHSKILVPALTYAYERGNISKLEFDILRALLNSKQSDAAVFKPFFKGRSASSVSQVIARFKTHGLIASYPNKNSRTYVVNFCGKDLLRALISSLDNAGYLLA
ncbi:MAG: Fic family protein [Ignavibacteria bacterium]|nr:Fic family protein [Ignavibacteria bacterium]